MVQTGDPTGKKQTITNLSWGNFTLYFCNTHTLLLTAEIMEITHLLDVHFFLFSCK